MAQGAITVRPAQSESDLTAIANLDGSFSTSAIYRIAREQLAFRLVAESIHQPLVKVYRWPELSMHDGVLVACAGDEIAGFAELRFDAWNNRARIEHLYVSGSHRGHGMGRLLINAMDLRARAEPGMRCLWLETQNLNYPAVQFYLRCGFRLCGLDETLYEPGAPGILPGEVALYFSRDLPR